MWRWRAATHLNEHARANHRINHKELDDVSPTGRGTKQTRPEFNRSTDDILQLQRYWQLPTRLLHKTPTCLRIFEKRPHPRMATTRSRKKPWEATTLSLDRTTTKERKRVWLAIR